MALARISQKESLCELAVTKSVKNLSNLTNYTRKMLPSRGDFPLYPPY